ncbi:MAG: isoprenyl transferase [Lachnospiraceae bacterium]|nr:isoprenyl transferase [Lachnospiraceae bacterium]
MDERLNGLKIPTHVAVILDGNGRWAKGKGLPRTMGHVQGAKNIEDMMYVFDELGVKYFTAYAFSTENWKRSEDEVNAIMVLLKNHLAAGFKKAAKNNVRIRMIGERTRLSKEIQKLIADLEEDTKNNTGLQFQLAVNYGSRDEIVRMMRDTAVKIKEGIILPEDINEKYISDNLDTKDIPDPDLMIRTSGEQRISNYLLWQIAYSELYFTPCYWPDFNKEELIKAIVEYNNRDRRYGNAK